MIPGIFNRISQPGAELKNRNILSPIQDKQALMDP